MLSNILKFCEKYLEEGLIVFLLVFLVLGVNVEVFKRYILNSSSSYMEEINRLTLIAIVYLGIPFVIKNRRNIICNLFGDNTRPAFNFFLDIVSNLVSLFFVLVMSYATYDLIDMQIMFDKKTEAMHLPIVYFTSFLLVGFSLSAVRLVQNMVIDTRHYLLKK